MSDPTSPSVEPLPPAGWYPDPENPALTRYWDGAGWAAQQSTVPLPAAVPPAPYAAATVATYTPVPLPPGPYTPAPPTDGFAITALILGVTGFVTGFLTSIPAVIFGFLARGRIKRNGTQGSGMALTGIILGFVGIFFAIIGVVIALLLVAAFRNVAHDTNLSLNPDSVGARVDAAALGLQVETCKGSNGTYPSDQSAFDTCTGDGARSPSNDIMRAGTTVRYWVHSTSFCVQVDRVTNGSTYSGAWNSSLKLPTVNTCPEAADGTTPTATVAGVTLN